jgi:hypothetical protein
VVFLLSRDLDDCKVGCSKVAVKEVGNQTSNSPRMRHPKERKGVPPPLFRILRAVTAFDIEL